MRARDDAKAQYEAAVRERDRRAVLLAEAEDEVEAAYRHLGDTWGEILGAHGQTVPRDE